MSLMNIFIYNFYQKTKMKPFRIFAACEFFIPSKRYLNHLFKSYKHGLEAPCYIQYGNYTINQGSRREGGQ